MEVSRARARCFKRNEDKSAGVTSARKRENGRLTRDIIPVKIEAPPRSLESMLPPFYIFRQTAIGESSDARMDTRVNKEKRARDKEQKKKNNTRNTASQEELQFCRTHQSSRCRDPISASRYFYVTLVMDTRKPLSYRHAEFYLRPPMQFSLGDRVSTDDAIREPSYIIMGTFPLCTLAYTRM